MRTVLITEFNEQLVKEVSKLRIEYLDEEFNDLTPVIKDKLFKSNYKFLKNNLGTTLFISGIRQSNRMVSSVYLSLNSRAPNLMFPTGVYGEIYGVYTHPDYRNRGYAKQNMLSIMEYSKSLEGLSCLVLEASEQGAHLYQELGFDYYDTGYSGMVYYFK